MNVKYYKVGEAANLVRVHPQTLRAYHREGRVSCDYTPGGQRVFTLEQLSVLRPDLLKTPECKKVHYVRSSDGNEKLLESQANLLKTQYGKPDFLIQDKASGLNEQRPGLKRILRLAKQGKIDKVYITEKERLTRFGYSYLEELLKEYDVEIIILGESKPKTIHEELIQDFLSLLASFSGKYYRLRGHEQQKKFLTKINREVKN